MDFSNRPLGRLEPTTDKHIRKYPFSAHTEQTVAYVNYKWRLPAWHSQWDQGSEGACVGFGTSFMMSLLNKKRYDPWWLWREARLADWWDGNDDMSIDEGTWVEAACQVLLEKGHVRHQEREPDYAEGINVYRWARTVDEMRTAVYLKIPISIGVNWYQNFDSPKWVGSRRWIGRGDLGRVRGGHCVCIVGANDNIEAFRIKNSWGKDYPTCWIPYPTMQRLLDEWGEACLVTDR